MITYLGTDYGGYSVDIDRINSDSIIYDCGVGEDISFCLELESITGCKSYLFDPTPEVKSFLSYQPTWVRERYYSFGIGLEDGEIAFYDQVSPVCLTLSAIPGDRWNIKPKYLLPVKCLPTIRKLLSHENLPIAYCKLCLGGGYEYKIIPDMIKSGFLPTQLSFDWYHLEDTKRDHLYEILDKHGYSLSSVNYSRKKSLLILR